MQDAAKSARRVRRRLGFSQAEFAIRIDVALDTIRNWEQLGTRQTQPHGRGQGITESLGQSARSCAGDIALN